MPNKQKEKIMKKIEDYYEENSNVVQKINEIIEHINKPLIIKFEKCHANAVIPRVSQGDAGMDLYAIEDGIILPREHGLVKTGLKWQAPNGYYLKIASRSGLSYKNGIEVGAGVIDSSYRGEIGVILFNHSDVVFHFKRNHRIAQGIVYGLPKFSVVEESLDESKREDKGFGSSGL